MTSNPTATDHIGSGWTETGCAGAQDRALGAPGVEFIAEMAEVGRGIENRNGLTPCLVLVLFCRLSRWRAGHCSPCGSIASPAWSGEA
jgi:hypothetical protein